ncbi:AP-2 complex subunit mu-1 [Bathycoccus prasinos]|uniref:AP-2 complex subunit mu-1 n=1 Tax=Bathycoccus prasinos TaxID=41875 RepID=K8EQD7_9CHLO|nr:AP-2 complex subunit mu-1 [Bathycoccus prasinos]CCO20271.1 AP-2 complex subunit mu-1 [Bathycoccus prasinos]|eukprot:XP_007508654.1 AP-2 complex subunit mu-1 [Bathycoccus prasinos]
MNRPPPPPIALSAVFIVNLRGDVLIERQYRSDISRANIDMFKTEILSLSASSSSPFSGRKSSNGSSKRNASTTSSKVDVQSLPPIRIVGQIRFMFIRVANVYVCAATKLNVNVSMCFAFLKSAIGTFQSYFGKVNENNIRANFVLMYELFDEMCDNGYPQITSANVLKEFITQKASVMDIIEGKLNNKGDNGQMKSSKDEKEEAMNKLARARQTTAQMTGSVQWRRPGLMYKKNEVYLDVIETISCVTQANGDALRASCSGRVVLNAKLSGMPELKIGLNDSLGDEAKGGRNNPNAVDAGGDGKDMDFRGMPSLANKRKTIDLDDLQFHHCVNLSKFASDKVVSFVPPDGEFELMKYRVSENVSIPFKVIAMVKELGRTRVSVDVMFKSVFAEKTVAQEIRVRIPVPPNTAKVKVLCSGGKARYLAGEECLRWKIKNLPGGKEIRLQAEVMLVGSIKDDADDKKSGGKKKWSQPPLNVQFSLPMFTASGLRIRFLKVWSKEGYEATKWVRYLTTAASSGHQGASAKLTSSERKKMGDFEVRVNSDGNNNNIYNDNGENSVLNDNIGRLRISN